MTTKYLFDARDWAGKSQSGIIEAECVDDVRQLLREQKLIPVSISQSSMSHSRSLSQRQVDRKQLLMVTTEIAIMARSGVDLAECFTSAARHVSAGKLKNALQLVVKDLEDGTSLTNALQKQVQVFGSIYVASIAAGEASGNICEVLDRLKKLIENELNLTASIKSTMTYPVILLCISFGVVNALMFFVLPQFGKVFRSMGKEPPELTAFLIHTSQLFREYYWLVGLGLLATGVGIFILTRHPKFIRWWDELILNSRPIGPPLRTMMTGRIFTLMGTMLTSGVPLLEAIKLSRHTVRNSIFQEMFDDLENQIVQGRGLGMAVSGQKCLPEGASQMLSTGERSGKLAMVLQTIGEFYEHEAEQKIRQLTKLLEPAIIILMGAIVTGVVMSVIVPLLDLSSRS